ncbi:hypothetical protein [Vibrio splendidus]|uniref:hypothetical protein n=1 Tax=Vibrio splendidus TaxID=29497 RepID=UPI00211891D0|nr:hypothetical protein [Vibrio splendidus]MCQ8867370.1 hypothetical protein [Vibrio splendidus]
MFEELKDKHAEYVSNLEKVYANSEHLSLTPKVLQYRHLDKNDFNKLFQVVDMLQAQLGYDHLSGACLLVHSNLKIAFAKHGYASEIILGDAIVNGTPYMECGLKELTEQLSDGISHKTQKVHSWLLLENGQFFDATLVRDLTDGKMAAELYCYGLHQDNGNVVEYKPYLAGSEFVIRTNLVSSAHI